MNSWLFKLLSRDMKTKNKKYQKTKIYPLSSIISFRGEVTYYVDHGETFTL